MNSKRLENLEKKYFIPDCTKQVQNVIFTGKTQNQNYPPLRIYVLPSLLLTSLETKC